MTHEASISLTPATTNGTNTSLTRSPTKLRQFLLMAILTMLLFSPNNTHAQATHEGVVSGIVNDKSTHGPLDGANVVLRNRSDSTRVAGMAAHRDGAFEFTRVPWGTYVVECGFIGHTGFRTREFKLGPASPSISLGTISLKQSVLVLDEVVIGAERSLFDTAIDRRVYNVDRDVMAKSSTASEILQNIPSVQVDIDGNINLRGSPNVLVLINGQKSALMGKSRTDVLQQMPAGNIEKIEVITNPSARFTAEGTSGIINIVMKKGARTGVNGDATGHVGTAGRYNGNLAFSGNPGKFTLFGNYSYRDDRRKRVGSDIRTLTTPGSTRTYREDNQVITLPLVNLGNLGLSYHPDSSNTIDLSAEYFRRRPTRDGVSTILSGDGAGGILSDYDRRQTGYEVERETGVTAAFEHNFPKEGHELHVEVNWSDAPQSELAQFVEHWRAPVKPDPASDILFQQQEHQGHFTLDYSNPLDEDSKLETGYSLEVHNQDIRSDADSLDVARYEFFQDPARSYRFQLNQTIQAAYATYEHSLGEFTALAGLRTEYATVTSNLITGSARFADHYFGIYPTLHLAYKAGPGGEWQLNYSRRIRRPESDDLNPFPEYTDPYNIDSGNPRLKPESIHSVELGYRLRGERLTFFPSVYYRYKTNGFTRLTQVLNDSTFLRTQANLATDQSVGFEPVLTFSLGGKLEANLNGNVFYEQIDASNIGYAGKKSVGSWSGTFNVNFSPGKTTKIEVSSNHRSARLTPQGDSRPSFVLNLGARQNFYRDQFSLTFAVSDLLKTQKQDTQLDVTGIQQRVTNRRDSQIFYAGLTYHYGRKEKKDKEKPIQYEDQP